jgi:hypothetical protein
MAFQLLQPAFWGYMQASTGDNWKDGEYLQFDGEEVDTLNQYDHTSPADRYIVPSSMDGKSAFLDLVIRVDDVDTTGGKLSQIVHRDACGAGVNITYSYVYQTLGDMYYMHQLYCPVVTAGDYFEWYVDPGDDVNHNLNAHPDSCSGVLVFLDPIGTEVGPQYTP